MDSKKLFLKRLGHEIDFLKSLQKMDRSRPREGKQEVSKFFTGSFIKKYIYINSFQQMRILRQQLMSNRHFASITNHKWTMYPYPMMKVERLATVVLLV